MAAPVDINKARRVAGNIYAERSNTGTLDNFNVRSIDMLEENAVDLIYVFQYIIHIFRPKNLFYMGVLEI